MVIVDYGSDFKRIFNKLDQSLKERVEKILFKIINNPEIGKPMRYNRKGTRELYVKPFRLSYVYLRSENKVILLDLYHKKRQ